MSVCTIIDEDGFIKATTETTCSQYVLIDVAKYEEIQAASLSNMIDVLNSLFQFDPSIVASVNGAMFFLFFTGHSTGRLLKWLGKK